MASNENQIIENASRQLKAAVADLQRIGHDKLSLPGAVIQLAIGLIEAATASLEVSSRSTSSGAVNAADMVLESWAANCASLIEAMSTVLVELKSANAETEAPLQSIQQLPIAAAKFVSRTTSTVGQMSQISHALKLESENLMKRVLEVGTLRRTLQLKKLEHAKKAKEADQLEEELKAAQAESGPLMDRIERLQQNIQLGKMNASRRNKLENELLRDEIKFKSQENEVRKLENKYLFLLEKLKSLPSRRDRTLELIEQLKNSPHQKLFHEIQSIWQRLPVKVFDVPLPVSDHETSLPQHDQ